MHKAVILIHTLPDGSSHYDWFIDQPGFVDEHRLISFRSVKRPDSADSDSIEMHSLPLHRAKYLLYQGDIAQNRGHVRRIATGHVLDLQFEKEKIDLQVQWEHEVIAYSGQPQCDQDQSVWVFQIRLITQLSESNWTRRPKSDTL